MNREAEEFRISSYIKQANLEVTAKRLEQAESLLKDISETLRSDRKIESANFIDAFLASQQVEQATSEEIARVHPEQAEDDIKKLIVLLRHGDAMPGEQDLAADHLERLLKTEQAEGAQVCATDCRSDEGITVGLIDTIINSARLLKGRERTDAVLMALQDMIADDDVRAALAQPSPKSEPRLVECGGCVEACMKTPEHPLVRCLRENGEAIADAAIERQRASMASELELELELEPERPDITTKHGYPAYSVAQHDRIVGALRAELTDANNLANQWAERNKSLAAEYDAAQTRVVVVPGRIPSNGPKEEWYLTGWNACLDELARLNGKAVSEGLLRRIQGHMSKYMFAPFGEPLPPEHSERAELAATLGSLLGDGKEAGDVLVRE